MTRFSGTRLCKMRRGKAKPHTSTARYTKSTLRQANNGGGHVRPPISGNCKIRRVVLHSRYVQYRILSPFLRNTQQQANARLAAAMQPARKTDFLCTRLPMCEPIIASTLRVGSPQQINTIRCPPGRPTMKLTSARCNGKERNAQ
jgi:hypothetical protein